MKEAIKQREKRCPVCEKEYPEEDNYCGDDGSVLEQARAVSGKHLSRSGGIQMAADGMNATVPREWKHEFWCPATSPLELTLERVGIEARVIKELYP